MENIIIAVQLILLAILCNVALWQHAILQKYKKREKDNFFDNISRTKGDDMKIRSLNYQLGIVNAKNERLENEVKMLRESEDMERASIRHAIIIAYQNHDSETISKAKNEAFDRIEKILNMSYSGYQKAQKKEKAEGKVSDEYQKTKTRK